MLDTFAIVPVALEFTLCHALWGLPGLWVAYSASWLCQAVTLWFNVVNHPPHHPPHHAPHHASGHAADGAPPAAAPAAPAAVEAKDAAFKCVASDRSDPSRLACPTPLFHVLNAMLWSTDLFGEEVRTFHDLP